MNYKEAWGNLKKTLKIFLLVNDCRLIKIKDTGNREFAKAIIQIMEEGEKEIEEEV